MEILQAERHLLSLGHIRAAAEGLRDAEEGVALRGDLGDLLLPLDEIASTMRMRITALKELKDPGALRR